MSTDLVKLIVFQSNFWFKMYLKIFFIFKNYF